MPHRQWRHTASILAALLVSTSAFAQSKPYVQLDVGGDRISAAGTQFDVAGKVGMDFGKYFGTNLSLTESLSPSVNSLQFRLTPYVQYDITPYVAVFAGPQIGAAQFSGPATYSVSSFIGGATGGFKFNTGWQNTSVLMQYQYTRSFDSVMFGPNGLEPYNANQFTVGLRKQF